MSMWSRVKSMLGGHGPLVTVASAATTQLPDDDNAFFISGSATITNLKVPQHLRNRKVTLIGAASAAVVFTNTDTLTTAGQMYLQGANQTLTESDVIQLFCQNDGTWVMLNFLG